ncbi:MAG: hypothetical protein WBV67_05290, partial [Candidatus Cybelea sp.]
PRSGRNCPESGGNSCALLYVLGVMPLGKTSLGLDRLDSSDRRNSLRLRGRGVPGQISPKQIVTAKRSPITNANAVSATAPIVEVIFRGRCDRFRKRGGFCLILRSMAKVQGEILCLLHVGGAAEPVCAIFEDNGVHISIR